MLFWRNRHEVRDEELNAFVDGELDEPARLRVERHMDSCTSCSETLAELQAVSRAMSELPSVQAPRSFALREADVLPAPASGATGLFGSVTPLLSGVAAIAIVAFVVLVGVDITEQNGSRLSTTDRTMEFAVGEEAAGATAADDATGQAFEYFSGYEDGDGVDGAGSAENAAPPQNGGMSPDGEGLSEIELDPPAVGDSGGRLDKIPDVLPEEIEEDPLSGELDQAFSGDNIALELADDGSSTGLRVAESVAAAVAIAATGAVLLIWRRNRTTAG